MGLFKRRRSSETGRFTSGPNDAKSYDDRMNKRSKWRKTADEMLDIIEDSDSDVTTLRYLHSLYCHVSSKLRP